MRRTVRSFIVIALASIVVAPGLGVPENVTAGTVVDEGWVAVRTTSRGGHQAVRFRDVPESWERASGLIARTPSMKTCSSITTAPCSTAPDISFSAILQPCSSTTQLDCVAEFGTADANGVRTPAVYATPFPKKAANEFAAEPSVGLPFGGPGGLWTVAESSGAPVRSHYVGAMVWGSAKPGQKITFSNFYATVSPVGITTFPCDSARALASDCAPAYAPNGEDPNDPDVVGFLDSYGREQGLDCIMTGNADAATQKAECALRKAISKDVTYYLTVRLSQAVSGWMHGRMADPAITIEDVAGSAGAVTVSVAAKAVSVPAVDIEKKFADLPTLLQDKYRATGNWAGTTATGYGDAAFETDPLLRNRESRPMSHGSSSIEELEAWLPVVNDTAVADLSTWAVRTLGRSELGAADGCVTEKNKVAGIVTTNATVYKAAAPVYDSASGTLNYTVAAPHYMSSGDLFKGAYSLIIRSDIARCIYKFTSAPVTSTIEVIDTGGETSTAVTNVSETDGWIKLSASGFTHSTPTIRAKMTQEAKASTATPNAGNTPTVSSPEKVTSKVPRVGKGRAVSRTQLLKWADVKSTKRTRVTLSVSKSPRGVCFVSGSTVKAQSKGTCVVAMRIQVGSKRTTKTVKFRIA